MLCRVFGIPIPDLCHRVLCNQEIVLTHQAIVQARKKEHITALLFKASGPRCLAPLMTVLHFFVWSTLALCATWSSNHVEGTRMFRV
jgi:hypothetical protein